MIWAICGYNLGILEGKKTDKEYYSLDIFASSNNFIFRSILTNREIIILDIGFFALFFKGQKLTIEKFKHEKNKINDSIKKGKELTLYIKVKNKIINYNNSFDLLVNELINLKIFEGQNTKEEIKIVEKVDKNEKNDKNKIYETKEIDDLKL